MTELQFQALEQSLIDIVSTELEAMESFCQPGSTCDVATTVAFRLSRAVIASICNVAFHNATDLTYPLSADTVQYFANVMTKIDHLNLSYEALLAELPISQLEWEVWKA